MRVRCRTATAAVSTTTPGNIKRARGSASTDEQAGRYNSFVYGAENNDDLVLILSNQSLISGNPAPLNGYDAFAEDLYLALHSDPVVLGVQPVESTIAAGEPLSLPATVLATLQGPAGTVELGVQWDGVGSESLVTPGEHEVRGRILGLHEIVTAKIIVTVVAPSPTPTTTPTATPTPTTTAMPVATPSSSPSGAGGMASAADQYLARTGFDGGLLSLMLIVGVLILGAGAGAVAIGRARIRRH